MRSESARPPASVDQVPQSIAPAGPGGPEPVVFVSHSTADHDVALRLVEDLEADGIPCWIAPRDVPASTDYAAAIVGAIEHCPLLMVLLSSASAQSDHVERELHLAVSVKATVVPVRLEPVELPPAVKYHLANVQYIDAVPRLEPKLSTIRAELRRVLRSRGTIVPKARRSRFHDVVATAAAWALIALFEIVLLAWARQRWFNLASAYETLGVALMQPTTLGLFTAVPAAALAMQYWANRNLARVHRLDALFSLGAGAGRYRLAVALAMCLVPAYAVGAASPAVTVGLLEGDVRQVDTHVAAVECLASSSYHDQTQTYYRVDARTGTLNPAGTFQLRVTIAPYATRDGVEFCEVRTDPLLADVHVAVVSDDRPSGSVVLTGTLEQFAGVRSVLITVRHYRDSEPAEGVTLTARLSRDSVEHVDDHSVSVPLR